MSDRDELAGYIDAWWQAIADMVELLESLEGDDWSTPTDLPGWDVKAIASHIAHLEGVLGGGPEEHAEVGELPHVKGPMGQFTEVGVLTRRDTAPAEIIDQIRTYATTRHRDLVADPPTDGRAPAPGLFGAIGWDTRTLLRNRPLDVWMHEQDIRHAIGRPGNLDTAGAVHTTNYLLASLGYVLAKRLGAAPGTSVVAHVDGHDPVAYAIGEDGKGRPLTEVPTDPTLTLRTDRDTYTRLAGGRGTMPPDAVTVEGDERLGRALVAQLAVTP